MEVPILEELRMQNGLYFINFFNAYLHQRRQVRCPEKIKHTNLPWYILKNISKYVKLRKRCLKKQIVNCRLIISFENIYNK